MRHFGDVLQDHLDRAGLTQRAYARAIGASQSHLQKILRGERRPPVERLERWLEALPLSPAQRADLHIRAHLALATPWFRTYVLELMQQAGRTLADVPRPNPVKRPGPRPRRP